MNKSLVCGWDFKVFGLSRVSDQEDLCFGFGKPTGCAVIKTRLLENRFLIFKSIITSSTVINTKLEKGFFGVFPGIDLKGKVDKTNELRIMRHCFTNNGHTE